MLTILGIGIETLRDVETVFWKEQQKIPAMLFDDLFDVLNGRVKASVFSIDFSYCKPDIVIVP